MKITQFRDENRFLSNFYYAPVIYEGIEYKTSENAFQAAKCANPADRQQFANLSPLDAKRIGKKVALRPDWEDVKFDIMREIVLAKFTQNEDLKIKLMYTKGAYLEEGNTWGDTVWGIDMRTGQGENNLGKILMQIRDQFIAEE